MFRQLASRICTCILLCTLASECGLCQAAKVEVQGVVRDMWTETGIHSVDIWLVSAGAEPKKVAFTNASGEFVFSIPEGKYTLEFRKIGYKPAPPPSNGPVITINANKKAEAVVGKLMRASVASTLNNDEKMYLRKVADKIVRSMKESKMERSERFRSIWKVLRDIDLPPLCKAELCAQIALIDPQAVDVFPPLKQYVNADARKIEEVEELFSFALTKKDSNFPTKAFVAGKGVGDEVLVDIAMSQLRTGSDATVTYVQRHKFYNAFVSEWMGKPAGSQIETAYKDDFRVIPGGMWPHWMGPARNGASPETGLLVKWAELKGPRLIWKARGGEGLSSVVVADGRAVTQVQEKDGGFVVALDAITGKRLWSAKIGLDNIDYRPGATPAIDGELVYVCSPTGKLICLSVATGKEVWTADLVASFGGRVPKYGMLASPLVDGDRIYAIPGGERSSLAAFDKRSGKALWLTGSDRPGYASPVPVTGAGQKQIVFFTASLLSGVAPETGKMLWQLEWTNRPDSNFATPLLVEKDMLFVSSGHGVGCALLKVSGTDAKVVWQSKGESSVLSSTWPNAVVHDGYLYGFSEETNRRIDLNCVDAKTGKRMWSRQNYGESTVILAEGNLFILTKGDRKYGRKGELVLVSANPRGYEEKGRIDTQLVEIHSTPSIAGKRLYVRDQESIYCFDIAARE